ncbi:MAG: vWA domain-containing protein [Polyangia bacterium]
MSMSRSVSPPAPSPHRRRRPLVAQTVAVAVAVAVAVLAVLLPLLVAVPARAASCPNVGIILDRSSSMNLAPDGSGATAQNPSRWSVAVEAVNNIVATNDGKFPMGLVLFPKQGTAMCETRTGFDIPIGYGKKADIVNTLAVVSPGGDTPTAGAIRGALADPALSVPTRQQYLILITDGQPCCAVGCSDYDVQKFEAVKAVEEAYARNPSVRTFVVGFGQLNPQFTAALNEMADAGGKPAATTGTIRFYRADSAASLNAALDSIIKVVIAGGGDIGGSVTVCDDSCYSTGCPATPPGQICAGGRCQSNPCDGTSCAFGQYCYTDGTSASCASPCWQSCPAGQRCVRGSCTASKCSEPCPSGTACDEAAGFCRTDTRCNGVACKPGQGCRAGVCVDDPCSFVRCPADTTCIALEGTCQPNPGAQPPVEAVNSGCSCDLGRGGGGSGGTSSGLQVSAALLLGGLILLRSAGRRRRGARGGFTSRAKFGE